MWPLRACWESRREITVAHLRAVFGVDRTPVDLDPEVIEALTPVEVRYLSED